MLVELAIERNQQLPALIYESRPAGGYRGAGHWVDRGNQGTQSGGEGDGGETNTGSGYAPVTNGQQQQPQQRAAGAVAEGQVVAREGSSKAASVGAGAAAEEGDVGHGGTEEGRMARGPVTEGVEEDEAAVTLEWAGLGRRFRIRDICSIPATQQQQQPGPTAAAANSRNAIARGNSSCG